MLSPHGRVRERALFTMAIDADRERRAAGLPEPERLILRSRPMDGVTLLARMRARSREMVQVSYFTGG